MKNEGYENLPGASPQRRVAVIGGGVSGLAAAWRLRNVAQVTLYEANDYFGGHAHTVDVTLPNAQGQPVTHGVDTGFLVLNERTYPLMQYWMHQLDVPLARSDMSFSVQVNRATGRTLEWNGSTLNTVFAQRRNLLSPRFWGMLADIMRFNRLATALAVASEAPAADITLHDFLERHRFGVGLRDDYLLPMLGCIWSCPTEQMLRFPMHTLVRFCHNHGLLQVQNRPQWYTVAGGSRQYVQRVLADLPDARLRSPVRRVQRHGRGVSVMTDQGWEAFDAVIFACHSPQALALLDPPSPQERALLGAMRTQSNRAVLHTDTSVMPHNRLAWAAWNYQHALKPGHSEPRVCLHYWINRLQPLPFAQPVLVTLNPQQPIRSECILGQFDYAHPVFDGPALAAQSQLAELQGRYRSYYCGAWTGYGFHEDGLSSGWKAADQLMADWDITHSHHATATL